MLSLYVRHVTLAAPMLGFAAAQASVPKDLSAAFNDSGVDLQVSFTNNAVDGFRDGTTFSKDQVSKEPTFALGDSSGISTTTLFTIIMVDTTIDNARTLHYARSNFKVSAVVNIETQDAPTLAYKAPGAFGEIGDGRKYTFLMYTNPQRAVIKTLKTPEDGKSFDVKRFETDNGLSDPSAGMGMVVQLGGGNGQTDASSSSAAAAPEESSAGSIPGAVASTFPVGSSTSVASSIAASSSVARSTNVVASRTSSPALAATSAGRGFQDGTTILSGGPIAPAATSTIVSSVVPDASGALRASTSGSSTSSAPLSVQTGLAASYLWVGRLQCAFAGSLLIAIAGFLFG